MTPPGRAWRPHRPGTVATHGGSLSGDCTSNAPPSNPQPTPWGKPSGSGNFNEDDMEVTFPRGGGWVPLRQPSPTPALVQPDWGWVPQGPPPQPLRPALADPGCGASNKHTSIGFALGNPQNQHLQWQSYAR